MITWTPAGAVRTPDALQVRVGATFHERLAVGAPTPSRGLRLAEVARNVRYFTVEREGPRARAVRTLVLSGVSADVPAQRALAEVVTVAREGHVGHVVVHAEADAVPAIRAGALGGAVDDVVSVVSPTSAACPADATASVRLDQATVDALDAVVERVARARRVVFTWPFPVPGAVPPPAAAVVMAALRRVVGRVPSPSLKGLPPCAWGDRNAPELQELFGRVGRTRNRFYVDAEHQLGDALVFFPDLVRWTKSDRCRRCAVDTRCDGVVGAWYDRGLAGALEPLSDDEEPG